MKTKKYYCSSSSSVTKMNMAFTLFSAAVAIFGLILLVSPLLMYRIGLSGDGMTYIIIGACICYFAYLGFLSGRTWRRLAQNPTLEIDEDSITIANHNNGSINIIKYKDIARFDLTEIKLLGNTIKCINVVPKDESYDRIISHIRTKADRIRVERLYKKDGIVELIYEHLLDQTIVAVYEDLIEIFNHHNNAKEN